MKNKLMPTAPAPKTLRNVRFCRSNSSSSPLMTSSCSSWSRGSSAPSKSSTLVEGRLEDLCILPAHAAGTSAFRKGNLDYAAVHMEPPALPTITHEADLGSAQREQAKAVVTTAWLLRAWSSTRHAGLMSPSDQHYTSLTPSPARSDSNDHSRPLAAHKVCLYISLFVPSS